MFLISDRREEWLDGTHRTGADLSEGDGRPYPDIVILVMQGVNEMRGAVEHDVYRIHQNRKSWMTTPGIPGEGALG